MVRRKRKRRGDDNNHCTNSHLYKTFTLPAATCTGVQIGFCPTRTSCALPAGKWVEGAASSAGGGGCAECTAIGFFLLQCFERGKGSSANEKMLRCAVGDKPEEIASRPVSGPYWSVSEVLLSLIKASAAVTFLSAVASLAAPTAAPP
jgi:hypothetical protein